MSGRRHMLRRTGIWKAVEREGMLFDCDTTLRLHGEGWWKARSQGRVVSPREGAAGGMPPSLLHHQQSSVLLTDVNGNYFLLAP